MLQLGYTCTPMAKTIIMFIKQITNNSSIAQLFYFVLMRVSILLFYIEFFLLFPCVFSF